MSASSSPVPLSLANFDAYKQADIDRMNRVFKSSTISYVQSQIQEVMNNNSFYMNIEPQYLENVLSEHFKNQFETRGASGGASFDASDMTPGNYRVRVAANMFGLDWQKMRPADYEKYGSLQSSDLVTAYQTAPYDYGSALVRFKREAVINRLTYTLDDSLGLDAIPGRVNKGDISFSDYIITSVGDSKIRKAFERGKGYTHNASEWLGKVMPNSSYIELQYHGNLSMRDVESIVFERTKLPSKAVINKLKALGIRLYKYNYDRTLSTID